MRTVLRDRPYALLLGVFLVTQCLDAALTAVGLHAGLAEGNPWFVALARHVSLPVALTSKVLVYGGALLLLSALIRRVDRTIGLVSIALVCLLMVGVVCWNLALLTGH